MILCAYVTYGTYVLYGPQISMRFADAMATEGIPLNNKGESQ